MRNEAFRICKEGVMLIGSVPYLLKIHRDPDDFFKYSDSSLYKIFIQAGFKKVKVKTLSYGPFSASVSFLVPLLKFNILKMPLYFIAVSFNRMLKTILSDKTLKADEYPLAYFFLCEK